MSERGVFAVDRGIFTDPDFASEPFTEREAFLWLVSEAAWKPHDRRADGKIVRLDRGQLCHAVRFMADAWQWSKSRVDRFLARLENRDMIKRDHGTRTPVLTVCNYDRFQRVALPERDNSGTSCGTTAGQQRDKLENIENKEVISSSLRSEESAPAKRATVGKRYLPDDWRPNATSYRVAAELGHDDRWADAAGEEMRCWAKGKGEKRADWDMTHQGWMRRKAGEQGARPPPRAGPRPPSPQRESGWATLERRLTNGFHDDEHSPDNGYANGRSSGERSASGPGGPYRTSSQRDRMEGPGPLLDLQPVRAFG